MNKFIEKIYKSNKTLEKIDKVITKVNGIYLSLALGLMFIFVFCNVIGRYFFSFTYIWVEELSRYLMISVAFLGMGLAMRHGNIAAFNVFQGVLPPLPRTIVRILVLLIIFSFMIIFFYLGLQYALRNMANRTEALRWRAGIWYLMIPIGSFLFIWHTLFVSKEYILRKRVVDDEYDISKLEKTDDEPELKSGEKNK
jgi:TRAP-type C4-dicarboxylate transport system permease small subunit